MLNSLIEADISYWLNPTATCSVAMLVVQKELGGFVVAVGETILSAGGHAHTQTFRTYAGEAFRR